MTRWQWIRSWPSWGWALAGVFVAGLLVAAVVLVGDDGDDETGSPATTTTPAATTTPATTERATATTASTTAPPTTTTPRTTTTSRTATDPSAPAPGAVVADAHSGGGSGEVQVDWNAVPHATGYRVLRTDTGGGQARVVADFDITTGRTTAAAEVVTLWSEQHNYVPDRGPLTSPDRSPWFQHIDYAAGNDPLSAVTCGAPIGEDTDGSGAAWGTPGTTPS